MGARCKSEELEAVSAVMEQILRESVELTECELDAVAWGRPFGICQQNEQGANEQGAKVINIGSIVVYDCISSAIRIG